LLARSLPVLAADGASTDALAEALLGAHLSTSVNVLGGIAHALTHQLGARYRVEHGILSGIVLPPCAEFVQPAAPAGVARVAATLGTTDAAAELRSLVASLGLPGRLRDVGVPREELPLVARDVLAGLSIRHSARPVSSADEVAELLERCW
jgi:alcohol dehydrogenase class IV